MAGPKMSKSWAATLIPLAVYILGFIFSLVTGQEFTEQQVQLLQGILYAFITAAAVGGTIGISSRLSPSPKPTG